MIKKYLRESLAELNNVTWPTRKQGIRITTIVFIFMVVSAAVLGFMDYLFSLGIRSLLTL
ncbi:preprotein translocase subunit SecE [Candidatus Peregrinibacteria bacterium]|nr:preprotein translocase subunit SecE [Candidatus Peregrinibacteria bacterium]